MSMDIRLLRHFIAIAECGTLTKAADQLDLAQSAISQSLAKLEAELGTRLFSRSRRGAELTAAGRAFLDDITDGVSLIDAATARAKDSAKGIAGKLSIGFSTTAIYSLLPEALRHLRANAPQVCVNLVEMKSADQPDALRNNEIDLGFVLAPVTNRRRLNELVVSEMDLIAAVPTDFPATADNAVSIRELAMYELISFPTEEFPDFRYWVVKAYQNAGSELRIAQETRRATTALACVAAGYGVTLVPSYVSGTRFHGVRFLSIRDAQNLPRAVLSILWRASAHLGPASLVIELFKQRGKRV